jgi:hypothetical protein
MVNRFAGRVAVITRGSTLAGVELFADDGVSQI